MLSSKIKLIYVFYQQSCALNQFNNNINNICWHGLHVIGVLVAKPYWWHKPSCKGLLSQILIFYKDLLQASLILISTPPLQNSLFSPLQSRHLPHPNTSQPPTQQTPYSFPLDYSLTIKSSGICNIYLFNMSCI